MCVFGEADVFNEHYINGQEVIVQNVKGIIISGDDYNPPDYVMKTTRGVLFYRIRMPEDMSDQTRFAKSIEKRAMGRPITFSDINTYKKEIADYYLKYCNTFVAVVLPEQDCTDGVIALKVVESKVGEISVTGNYWFPCEYYLDQLSVQENEVLNSDQVIASLHRMNRSPWVKAEVVYKAGKNSGETDIELVVEDKKPIQFYAGADNTGFKVTEYTRLYAGFNWGNILDWDQTLAFCYTASPDFLSYQSYTLDYTVLLPNDDWLRFFGGYSHVQATDQFIPIGVRDGNSWQVSGRYEFHIPQTKELNQKVDLGMDFKSTNNDLVVGESSVSNLYANLLQIAADYTGAFTFNPHTISGTIGIFTQPWKLGSTITDAAYDALRPNANPLYIFGRGDIKYGYYTDDSNFSATIRAIGQLSSSALIPIEEFGMGGVNSIRGYVAREVNVDNAIIFNFDIFSPKISLLKYISNKYRNLDRFYAVGFVDIGNGWLIRNISGEPNYYFLAGAGPGLRYDISNNIYTRFDLGVRLTNPPFGATYTEIVRFYFSLIGTY
ncbi:MAG: hypothetical protein S4CHLAM20_05790 [Chlamydiia bacterium]|nr:hypothetical protein [Chlamydiia bacterium]